jgi:hypothetical protein
MPQGAKHSLHWALVISLVFHGVVLFTPRLKPKKEDRPASRLQARLLPRASAPAPLALIPPATAPARPLPAKPKHDRKLLALDKPGQTPTETPSPTWSTAERDEMNNFLRELDAQKKAEPSLAQRSLAMARAIGQQQARRDDEETELLERLPNSPPIDPLGLEMYLDGLVSKLNRSAAFVKNDPRSRGFKTAAVLVRLNPNGSLQSFKVLNEADQQIEIAFIKSVVERAVPFPAFPPELQKSARSLAMIICIFPLNSGGGFGFTRTPDGHRC